MAPDGALVWEDAHTVALAPLKDSTKATGSFPNPVGLFRTDIKEEWVNAVFGRSFSFFPTSDQRSPPPVPDRNDNGLSGQDKVGKNATTASYIPAVEGVGLAGVESYVAYGAVIPAGACNAKSVRVQPSTHTEDLTNDSQSRPKLGITLSRIPLGLYVRAVDAGGEAFSAGIVPGSILVAINSLGVLGEPSHTLLERIWYYEGIVGEDDSSILCESPGSTSGDSLQHFTYGGIQSPVALQFIRDGKLYDAVMLSKAPFGISWAPCGNFALVQKSYSFAEKAGVRRGCLVAAVNGKSLRDTDHVGTAEEMKRLYMSGEEITLTLAFTPAASRTGSQERDVTPGDDNGEDKSPSKDDSIFKIKRRISPTKGPKSTHLEGILNCGTGKDYLPESSDVAPGGTADPVHALAFDVSSGATVAPTGSGKLDFPLTNSFRSGKNTFKKCPVLSKEDLLVRWNALESLLYCIFFHLSGFNERIFEGLGGTIGLPLADENLVLSGQMFVVAPHNAASALKMLERASSAYSSANVIDGYLIQFLSLLSSGDITSLLRNSAEEEMKVDEFAACCVDILLDQALKNDDLCQRFNFLLRSFMASREEDEKYDAFADGGASEINQYDATRILQDTKHKLSSLLKKRDASQKVFEDKEDNYDASADTLLKHQQDSTISNTGQDNVNNKGRAASKKKVVSKNKKIGRIRVRLGTKKRKSKSAPLATDDEVVDASIDPSPSPRDDIDTQLTQASMTNLSSQFAAFESMDLFLQDLEATCSTIEGSLQKSLGAKIAEWALQPWSENNDITLANVTAEMRNELQRINSYGNAEASEETMTLPLLNPVDTSELLLSVVPEESHILPSAHFPLLLCFDSCSNPISKKEIGNGTKGAGLHSSHSIPAKTAQIAGNEILYRTSVEVIALHESASDAESQNDCSYVLHGEIAGVVQETASSIAVSTLDAGSRSHEWTKGNVMFFETRSRWGGPKTLSARLSSIAVSDEGVEKPVHTDTATGRLHYAIDAGYFWVDLSTSWDRMEPTDEGNTIKTQAAVTCHARVCSFYGEDEFDHSGYPTGDSDNSSPKMEVELKITNECIALGGETPQRRVLLYKHDDDMRQEMVALQFIETCDHVLRASGLDLKLLTFRSLAVGKNKGFIEWVNGAVPLSEVCKPVGGPGLLALDEGRSPSSPNLASYNREESNNFDSRSSTSRSFGQGQWCKYESLRCLELGEKTRKTSGNNIYNKNPIQDFLRAAAYDSDAPFLIRKDVMDTYVRSCAGYCVITYLLGVGDRHLDNLLLHPNGYFLHCDYSFILGQDPKTYLPMRITEDMVLGMGGRNSDNFTKFLSLAGAAFVALRRHSNVRLLMSLVRTVAFAGLPDLAINQDPTDALLSMRSRFRLDLGEDAALSFIERLIESSITSKMWMAVDAMHQLGKRF